MMKGKLLIAILLAATCAMTNQAGHAQRGKIGAAYNRPLELKLQGTAGRLFRSHQRQYSGQAFYTENFYPIGWSKNGNFAYYVEPVDEACGCYFARLFTLDLKTDKVLWKFEHEGDFVDDDRKAGKHYALSTIWRANQKLFSDELREHGIEPLRRLSLLSFPANHQGDILTADLQTQQRAGLEEDARLYVVGGVWAGLGVPLPPFVTGGMPRFL